MFFLSLYFEFHVFLAQTKDLRSIFKLKKTTKI